MPILSTPHGALGTLERSFTVDFSIVRLSTPHGALGTLERSFTVDFSIVRLSTPHGALGTGNIYHRTGINRILSTPHGALGTGGEYVSAVGHSSTFNSTRCIRNKVKATV